MAKVAEGIGKSYDEAVADALSKVGLTKEQVSIEIIDEPKKRLFSILDPKQVKVRITEVEKAPEVVATTTEKVREYKEITEEDAAIVKERIIAFLNEYFEKLGLSLKIESYIEDNILRFDVTGDNAGIAIGYRGETMEALQMIATTVGNKGNKNYVRVIIDIEGYRKKELKP
ncbi:MAG: Jag N-terminal domain-containing protein [Clostridia bacterium]|nr:Jag N-terminal domain-containing protein [Clostridia bacterium]